MEDIIILTTILTITFIILFYYFLTIKIRYMFKNSKNRYWALDVKSVKNLLNTFKDQEVIGNIHEIVFTERDKSIEGKFVAAQIFYKIVPLKGKMARIEIYPYCVDNDGKYFMEGSFNNKNCKFIWKDNDLKKAQLYSLAHELGHLRLYLDGIYDTNEIIEQTCDKYAEKMGYPKPNYILKVID